MTGISVGGTFPLVFSLVGDLFYVTQRANVAAGVQVATGVGFAAGQAIAGFVGESSLHRQSHAPFKGIKLYNVSQVQEIRGEGSRVDAQIR